MDRGGEMIFNVSRRLTGYYPIDYNQDREKYLFRSCRAIFYAHVREIKHWLPETEPGILYHKYFISSHLPLLHTSFSGLSVCCL